MVRPSRAVTNTRTTPATTSSRCGSGSPSQWVTEPAGTVILVDPASSSSSTSGGSSRGCDIETAERRSAPIGRQVCSHSQSKAASAEEMLPPEWPTAANRPMPGAAATLVTSAAADARSRPGCGVDPPAPSATCPGAILLGMLRTAFTELVGCQVPIQLAPMGGGVVTPELAIAVSGAGGLGMLQRAGPDPLADRIGRLQQAQAGPFGVNFPLPHPSPGDRAEIELAAGRARLVEFFWADPDPTLVGLVHGGGALAGWQVGSVGEAKRAVDA